MAPREPAETKELLSPTAVHAINKKNLSEIRSRSSADAIYLSDHGPQTFEPLPNAAKQLAQAIKRELVSDNWEWQFFGCNVIRNACRFHLEDFSADRVRKCIDCLLRLADSLRSSVVKNAMLALTDLFQYLQDGMISDALIIACYKKLVKKVGESNAFISNSARAALQTIVDNTVYWKSIQFLYPHYEDRSPNVRA